MDAESGKTFPTIDPSTEKVIAQVAEGDKVNISISFLGILTHCSLFSSPTLVKGISKGIFVHTNIFVLNMGNKKLVFV